MSEGPRSVAFDRAAEYYDDTRGLSPEGTRRQTDLLVRELKGRGRVIEVGVGTGQVALPLFQAGVNVVGLDLARSMLAKIGEKAAGRSPFPLVQADATRMPFGDGSFGAAYFRWVLHLIPGWREALSEAVRIVGPGGTILVSLGSVGRSTPESEIHERFARSAGVPLEPSGLMWADYDELDVALGGLGAKPRPLPTFTDVERLGLDSFIDGIAKSRYSWTWRVKDPELLASVAGEVRRWAEERFGPLDEVPRAEREVNWRAYDLS